MSKTSVALIVLFFISLTTLLILNAKYSSNPVLPSFPKMFPTQTVISESTLSLSPTILNVQPGKRTSLQIIIENSGQKPSLIQMELAYDPSVISNVSFIPGSFYQNPDVLLTTVNARNGRISYAIAPSKGQEDTTGSNVVTTLMFTPRLTTRQTTISFMPKTLVQTEETKNTLKTTFGATIKLQSGFEPVPASPSAIIQPEVPYQLPTAF